LVSRKAIPVLPLQLSPPRWVAQNGAIIVMRETGVDGTRLDTENNQLPHSA